MPLSPIGLLHVAFFLVLIPWRVLKSKRAIDAGHAYPPTRKLLQSALFVQLICIVFGLAVVKADWLDLFPAQAPTGRDLLLALGALVFLVATIPLRWRATPPEARRRMAQSMPQNGREMALWVPIALCAGFGEELNYRGVLVQLLHIASGSFVLAAALSAVAFAVAHATQGWRKVGFILLFALIVQGLVIETGTLYLAMAVHAIYDVIAGVAYGRLTRGLRDAGAPLTPAARA